jgi:hypothetical protein
MPKALIQRFNGGMINDPRTESSSSCMVATNFDINTNPSKLLPNRATESGYSGQSTGKLQNFTIGYRSAGAEYVLFGLGVVSGQSYANILYKTLSSLDTDAWSTPAYGASASGATSFDLFVYYQRTGLIYGAKAGTHIWAFDTTAGAAFAETHRAISYTTIAQGLVHSKDDVLYIPYDNKIASNNNGSWTDAALTLPEYLKINSISEYGNYLVIACANKNAGGNSRLFLWDRNTSITTVSESIDLGYGEVKIIEEIDGTLISVSTIGGTSTSIRDKVVFRYLTGNQMIKFNELVSSYFGSGSVQLPKGKFRANGKLFFMLKMIINGATREGLFSIGRASQSSPFTVAHELTLNNATATSGSVLYNFTIVGDYTFMSYVDNSVYTLSKSQDQATYTTSIYESLINPGMASGDRVNKKQLVGVAVNHDPLTSGQTVVLKYRVDAANTANWTTIYTSSTEGDARFETSLDASGTQFTSGTNYEFRLESTGGAVITGLSYVYDNLNALV